LLMHGVLLLLESSLLFLCIFFPFLSCKKIYIFQCRHNFIVL
jgi:hypothetical protein